MSAPTFTPQPAIQAVPSMVQSTKYDVIITGGFVGLGGWTVRRLSSNRLLETYPRSAGRTALDIFERYLDETEGQG